MGLTELLILGCATWRISAMLAYERGPLDIFYRIRGIMGFDQYDDGEEEAPDNFIGNLLACVWCSSLWVGALFFISYILWPGVMFIALPLAISAVAVIVEQINHG